MNDKKIAYAGWLVAAVMGGVMMGSGFQSGADKFGVVDMNKAVQDSELGKKNREALDAAVNAREGIMSFFQSHSVPTVEQATKIKNLSLKTPLSDSEKTELEKLKQDVITAQKNFDALNQKANPTDDDRRLLQDYNSRKQYTAGLLDDWRQTFGSELQTLQGQLISDAVKKADQSIRDIAKKDGYTVVFTVPGATAYGSNDLTDSLTKSLNTK